jgi:tetratricopeptide (TPR) repeat protein
MRAIEAGQAAGGDSRGKQSAGILIVKDSGGYGGLNDRYCDLRVDDAKDPIKELRRIFDMWQVLALVNDGYQRVEAGDFAAAIRLGEDAVKLDPKSAEAKYDLACFYSRAGRKAEALAQLERAVKLDAAMGPRGATDTDLAPLKDDPKFQALTAARPKRPR